MASRKKNNSLKLGISNTVNSVESVSLDDSLKPLNTIVVENNKDLESVTKKSPNKVNAKSINRKKSSIKLIGEEELVLNSIPKDDTLVNEINKTNKDKSLVDLSMPAASSTAQTAKNGKDKLELLTRELDKLRDEIVDLKNSVSSLESTTSKFLDKESYNDEIAKLRVELGSLKKRNSKIIGKEFYRDLCASVTNEVCESITSKIYKESFEESEPKKAIVEESEPKKAIVEESEHNKKVVKLNHALLEDIATLSDFVNGGKNTKAKPWYKRIISRKD